MQVLLVDWENAAIPTMSNAWRRAPVVPHPVPSDSSQRHHVPISANRRTTAVDRLVERVPPPIRIGLWVLWAVAIIAMRWDGVDGHAWSPISWGFVWLGVGVWLILRLNHLVATFGDAARPPLDLLSLDREAALLVLATGGLLVVGPWWVLDGDPSTNPLIGGALFLVGLVLTCLFVRYLLKPVRGGAGPASPWRAKGPW